MPKTVYQRTVLTGGGVDSLDGIDGDLLNDDDAAIVFDDAAMRPYRLDATSGAAENSPNVIAPDTNPGNKRWILQSTQGLAVVTVQLFTSDTDVETGNGAGSTLYRVPSELSDRELSAVAACVATAGTTGTLDIQIHNITQAVDMLSTVLSIDSGELDSKDAATPAVIDTNNNSVSTGDQLRFDIDAVPTTAPKGCWIELQFT